MGTGREEGAAMASPRRTEGHEQITSRPPAPRPHPQTTSSEAEERILRLSEAHPEWGCGRLSEELHRGGVRVSSPTIQRILIRSGMGTLSDRMANIERLALSSPAALTPDHRRIIPTWNLATLGSFPGEILVHDTLNVGRLKEYGRLFMSVVIDTCCSLAIVRLDNWRSADLSCNVVFDAVALLSTLSIPVKGIATDEGREFRGGADHEYGELLAELGITHLRPDVRSLRSHGHITRFKKTFVRDVQRHIRSFPQVSLEDLRDYVDNLLWQYNHRMSSPGFQLEGGSPVNIINSRKGIPLDHQSNKAGHK